MKKTLTLLAVVAAISFAPLLVKASCTGIGAGQTAIQLFGSASLDAGQTNVTISVNGNLSGSIAGGGCEDPGAPPNPIPYCNWYGFAESVQGGVVSITSGTLSGQTIPVSVSPQAQQGSGCFDQGDDAGFSGSQTFGVGSLPNGDYTLTLSVTDDASQTATRNVSFTINRASYALTVSKSGSGSGTVTSSPAGISCGADCSQSYAGGTLVTLSQSAAAGSTFAGWSGACSGTGACSVTMNAAKSVTATFNTSGTSYTVTGTVGPNGTISPASRTVTAGNTTTFTVTPNAGYTASASGCGGTLGPLVSGSHTYTTGAINANCTVTATFTAIPAGTCTRLSVNSNVATNWLIGGPQIDGQYIESPGYPTKVTSGSHTTDSSGNTLPTGTYNIIVDTNPQPGWSNPTITPSSSQACGAGEVRTFTITYQSTGDDDDPPPTGIACSGPANVALNTNATFSASGGTSPYSWSASGANPSVGSGLSFTTKWATIGTKIVTVSGGGSDTCTICVGAFGSCDIEPPTMVQLDCQPSSQTVTTGQAANFSSYAGGNPTTVNWTATGGTPSSASGQSTFSTTYNTAGTKTVSISKTGGLVTYLGDTCSVTVTTPLSCTPAVLGTYLLTNATVYASGGTGSYTWSAPGGSPSSAPSGSSFTTNYNTVGAKTVTLTSGAASTNCTINVNTPPPALTCSPETQTILSGGTANFTGSGGSGGPYGWSAPGGSPSSGSGINFSSLFNTAGTFFVTVSESAID